MNSRTADKPDLDIRVANDRIFKCRICSESTKGGNQTFAALSTDVCYAGRSVLSLRLRQCRLSELVEATLREREAKKVACHATLP